LNVESSYLPVTFGERAMTRKKLTQQTVEKLKPDPAKVIERPCDLLPALRLIVQPSGSRSFAVRTRINGKTAKLTLTGVGVNLKAAREAARKILEEIAGGHDPRQAKRRAAANTLGALAEMYLADRAPTARGRTQVERERHLRRNWAPFHARPISSVTKGEVALRLQEIKRDCGPVAANRSRATLRHLFRWCVAHDILENNVVALTEKPHQTERPRDRVLTLEELRAIWAAAEGTFGAMLRLLMLTGARKSEVAGLTWGEVNLDKATWLLPAERSKNYRAHVVPLSRQALELIEAQPADNSLNGNEEKGHQNDDVSAGDLVFPFRASWVHAKEKLDKRLPQIAHWTVHDLRRSTVTGMNDLGIAPHVIEAVVNHIGGHKAGVAGVYNRAEYLTERTNALQAWADHLTTEPEVGKVVKLRSAG
jgi:integrase